MADTVNVRILSGAFLIEGSHYLMMHRSENKRIAPGMWGGVGGHVEPHEINDPRATCLREIFEETGIEEKHIEGLALKYIILRRNKSEITLLHYFIGYVATRYYEDKTQEGKLYWVNESSLFDRPMSFEIRKLLEHYRELGHANNYINVGIISATDNKPYINWHSLDEWAGIAGL